MEVRITKLRVAMAALFVLAGVGLASLLSPLVGTALATVGPDRRTSPTTRPRPTSPRSSSDRETGRRRRRRPAERGRDGTGRPAAPASPWRASQRHPQPVGVLIAGPSACRSTSPACPISTDAASGSGISRLPAGLPRAEQRHELATARRFRRRALAHPRPGRRRDAALVHLPDAAAMEATRKHESVPVRVRPTQTAITTMNAVGFYGG